MVRSCLSQRLMVARLHMSCGADRLGRPRKTWSQTITDEVNALSIRNVDPLNRLVWWNALDNGKHVEPLVQENLKTLKRKNK